MSRNSAKLAGLAAVMEMDVDFLAEALGEAEDDVELALDVVIEARRVQSADEVRSSAKRRGQRSGALFPSSRRFAGKPRAECRSSPGRPRARAAPLRDWRGRRHCRCRRGCALRVVPLAINVRMSAEARASIGSATRWRSTRSAAIRSRTLCPSKWGRRGAPQCVLSRWICGRPRTLARRARPKIDALARPISGLPVRAPCNHAAGDFDISKSASGGDARWPGSSDEAQALRRRILIKAVAGVLEFFPGRGGSNHARHRARRPRDRSRASPAGGRAARPRAHLRPADWESRSSGPAKRSLARNSACGVAASGVRWRHEP